MEDPPLVLAGNAAEFVLHGHLARLEDPEGGLRIDQVVHGGAFLPRPPDAAERSYTSGAVWYRFTVIRSAGMPADWILTIGEPFINDIRVYLPAVGGGFCEMQLGRRFPNDELPLAARHHVVRLDLPEAVPTTVYVRLASRDEIQFEAALWRPEALIFSEIRQSVILAMVFAAALCAVAVSMLFGLWLRDAAMLAYAAYVATAVMFIICHTGIVDILFPSFSGTANYLLIGMGVLGNIAALIFMWARVLDLRRTFPAIHRIYMAAGVAASLSLLTVPTPWYLVAVRPTFVATMAVTVASLGLAFLLLRRGKGSSLLKFYVAAFIPFLFFSLLHAAEAFFPSGLDIMLVRVIGTVAMLAHLAILTVALVHRIAQVQRDRLRADADLAATRAAMREQANFVSMLSHQLRTPLAVILAAVDLFELKQAGSAPSAKIRRAVLQMRDLTATVLAEYRLTEVAANLNLEAVALAPLLNALIDECRDGSARGVTFDCGGAGAIVRGDRTLLGVLFANLLDNAVKYSSPQGEIRVRMTSTDGIAAITVADDGPGIPPDEAERIFEKYYRSAPAASRPGTGLGLYLVRHIAHRHGGAVSLASVLGRGSAFTVTLPLTSPAAGE